MPRPPAKPHNESVSTHILLGSSLGPMNLDTGKDDIPDEEEPISTAKDRLEDISDASKDSWTRIKKRFGKHDGGLCATCEKIPFRDCLPVTSETSDAASSPPDAKQNAITFYRTLPKILENSDICNLCGLLKRSICQEDHDLLKAEHIQKYLPEDFDKNKSMSDWVNDKSNWSIEWFSNPDRWPFGYAVDKSASSKHTLEYAKNLFSEAEARDTAMNNVSAMYESIGDDAMRVVEAAQLALGAVPVSRIEDKNVQDVVAGMQFMANQVAIFQNKKRKRLPCIFMFRMYRYNEKKAGALSVRVYAHGGAKLAPLQEITHFSLRFESSGKPRSSEDQIWYGNKLGRSIDIPFFKYCKEECKNKHTGCARPSSTPKDPCPEIAFRLINVETMNVMEVEFSNVMREISKYQYTALSYRWGELKLLNGWFPEPNSGRTKSWKQKLHDGSWSDPIFDRPDRFKLRKGTFATFLYIEGSLTIAKDIIPNTILDAIEVTRKMGLRYIWVDQLCIMQSGDDADRDGNLERMDLIYKNAVFTIVAADGLDANSGLKGVTRDRNQPEQISEEIIPNANMSLPINIKLDIQSWEGRAWTFQEKVLSRRLLVFTGGFAIWYCRGGIWREDVNALDGDISAVRFPWPWLAASTPSGDKWKDAGLSLRDDGSIRLLRRPAMSEYVAAVEDFSARAIGDGWDTLSAFRGISKVLESSDLLGGPFRQGLPVQNMDVALLWQTIRPARRRENGSKNGNTFYAPPSWSPFGWEATSRLEDDGALHALVEYTRPYEVWFTELGMVQRRDPDPLDEEARKRAQNLARVSTEERVRPIKRTLWIIDDASKSLQPIDAYEQPELMNKRNPPDWKSHNSETEVEIRPRLPAVKILSDRSLVMFAETATLILSQQTWRVTTSYHVEGSNLSMITFEDADTKSIIHGKTIETRQEYWLREKHTDARIGVGRIDMAEFGAVDDDVRAVVLSEAQYLGSEKVPDVLGYPLYNVMLVREVTENNVKLIRGTGNQVYERVGLGQVYKREWKSKTRKKEVVIVE